MIFWYMSRLYAKKIYSYPSTYFIRFKLERMLLTKVKFGAGLEKYFDFDSSVS